MKRLLTTTFYGFLPVLVLLLSSLNPANAQNQTPEYTYVSNATGTNSIPFGGGTWADQRNQWLYAPGDFGTVPAGKAISVIYVRGNIADAATTWSNLKISLGQPSNVTGLTGTWITGLTKVMEASSYSVGATVQGDWIAFKLDVPFPYDPNKALVIETYQTGTTGGKRLHSGGTNSLYTGNTQQYAASSSGSATSRRYSYSTGFDLISLGPNDAGISTLVSPKNFCPGIKDVKIVVENFGTNQIDTVTINWALNGSTQTPILYTSKLDTINGAGLTKDTISLTSLTFTSSTIYTLKAWTSNPNNVTDTVPDNDTLTVTIRPSLSGIFTIGGTGADFATFSAAASALNNYGVCGPVTFMVKAGTYVEQLKLDNVAGTSSINTITFDGQSPDSVTIKYNSSTQADMATILISGTDWVRIKNMRIEANGTTYGVGVHIAAGADNNIITGNRIYVSSGTANSYLNPIVGSGSAGAIGTGHPGDSNLIENNLLRGGYRGIYFYGPASNNNSIGNKFINNNISDFYYYGMMIYYQSYMVATDNIVTPGTSVGYYACYFYYCHNFIIERNEFIGSNYNYLYYANYSTPYNSAFTSSFSNNIVYGGTSYGLYFYYSNHLNFYNNTIRTPGGTYGVYGYNYPGTNIDLRNNIFSNGNGGTSYYFYNANLKEMDYNIFDGNINVGGTVYATLADFKAAYPTYNENSSQTLPAFVNLTGNNLHLDQTVKNRRGANVGLSVDVDGDARCLFAPSIGADESNYPEPNPAANFSADDTIWVNSPYTFGNVATASDAKAHQWFLNGAYQTSALHFRYSPSATGNDMIKLITESCGGIDSITKTVIVAVPPKAPEAMFIADKYVADVYEPVTFTDLSTYGPVSWEWFVSPPTYSSQFGPLPTYSFLNGTSEFSQNPVMVFDEPGTYTITMVSTNSQGSDTAVRVRYIVIRASSNMCIFPFSSTVPSGSLYDDGGPTGNYSSGKNGINTCYYLIEPCASSVSLNISQFDLSTGDYLRVYDGSDKKGTPLWDISAYPNGMNGAITNASVVTTLVANSGKMYIEFESDNSATTVSAGLAAQWSSIPGNFDAPVADFAVPDTICMGIPVNFENLSTGVSVRYGWDLDDDGFADASTEDLTYTFSATGTYKVTLVAENCGGSNSIFKIFNVVSPAHAPKPAFTADIRRPNIGEIVNFFDATTYCTDSWTWEITPSTYSFATGSSAQSQNPQVIFNQAGYYNVKLTTGNSSGSDSTIIQQYIYAIRFCQPSVVNLNADLGISRFVLKNIDNSSYIGENGFTDYSGVLSATLQKGATYMFSVMRNTANNPMNRKVWIDFNQDGDFDDAGELVAYQSSSFSTTWSDSFIVPTNAMSGATRLRIGTSYGNLSNTPCGPNSYGEFEDYRLIISPDFTAPVITIAGTDTVTVEQCGSYTDAGATAIDNVDGDVSSQIAVSGLPVNTCSVGYHTLTYTVTDGAGNIGTATRVVHVIADTTKPVLTLNGANPSTLRVYTVWIEPGYSATDNVDGNLTSSVIVAGNVDTAITGTYFVSYSVTDAKGNYTAVTRTVYVVDDVAPVVTLTGSDTVYVEVGDSYNEAGAAATDNYDATVNVTISGIVNTSKVGTYTLNYCATDQAANGPACVTRTVIVQDTEAPVAILKGANPIVLEVYSNFIDPGVDITDNYYTAFSIIKSGTWTGTADSLGDFTLTYSITDGSGNITIINRIIRVVDTQKPIIRLNGAHVVYLKRWQTWVDPWVSVTDNYDTKPVVDTTTNFSGTLLEGLYFISYRAFDQSGNKSDEITRMIVVGEGTLGVVDGRKVSVNIYPNPNRGQFVVEVVTLQTEKVHIAVTDMTGREIQTVYTGSTNGGKFEVKMTDAKQGVYFVKVISGNHTYIGKFILAR